MVEARRVKRFRLAAFPLAVNGNDRRERPENDRRECGTAKPHVHLLPFDGAS